MRIGMKPKYSIKLDIVDLSNCEKMYYLKTEQHGDQIGQINNFI